MIKFLLKNPFSPPMKEFKSLLGDTNIFFLKNIIRIFLSYLESSLLLYPLSTVKKLFYLLQLYV